MKQPDVRLTLIFVAFELLAFGLLIYINNNGSTPLLIVLMVISFVLSAVFAILSFRPTVKSVKKLFVCALILLAGAALSGVTAVLFSGGIGWTPVGNSTLMGGLPLLISIAVCIWYWSK